VTGAGEETIGIAGVQRKADPLSSLGALDVGDSNEIVPRVAALVARHDSFDVFLKATGALADKEAAFDGD